jgi:Raf kinase inhibitor-like YbhB/YbcL family protein
MGFELQSDEFRSGETIPERFAKTDANVSPPLRWRDIPEGTRSLVLIVDDPDAPRGTFTHWLLWNVPATLSRLSEGWRVGDLGRAGRNDFGQVGYSGPLPPVGHAPHRYVFRLYALSAPALELRDGAARGEVDQALSGHVLGTAELVGRFARPADVRAHRA